MRESKEWIEKYLIIVEYLLTEDFTINHLNTLIKIISTFNNSRESENEVFTFANKFHRDYSIEP